MSEIYAITGGNGFLGRALRAELNDRGESFRLLSRSEPREFADAFQRLDLTTASTEEVASALKSVRVLFHLAGLVSFDPADGPAMMRIHVEGTRRLLAGALTAGVERIVLLSTSGTVGVGVEPTFRADDQSPYAMEHALRWPYYSSKIFQEKLCLAWARQHDRELIALRPSLAVGPGDHDLSSTGEILKFLRGEMPALPAGGISLVDVRDIASACYTAARIELPGLRGNPRSYPLGAENMTIRELAEELGRISGAALPRLQTSATVARGAARAWAELGRPGRRIGPLRDLDPVAVEMAQYFWYCDASRARGELDWRPRPIHETLTDTVRFLQNMG